MRVNGVGSVKRRGKAGGGFGSSVMRLWEQLGRDRECRLKKRKNIAGRGKTSKYHLTSRICRWSSGPWKRSRYSRPEMRHELNWLGGSRGLSAEGRTRRSF